MHLAKSHQTKIADRACVIYLRVRMHTVLAAEVIHYFFPKYVELHNYSPANSTSQKLENWRTLNRESSVGERDSHTRSAISLSPYLLPGKVLCKLDLNVPDEILQNVVRCKPGVIEYILHHIMTKVSCWYIYSHSSKCQLHGAYFPPIHRLSSFSSNSRAHLALVKYLASTAVQCQLHILLPSLMFIQSRYGDRRKSLCVREREREKERQRKRETKRKREAKRERQRQREAKREIERQADREKETERWREIGRLREGKRPSLVMVSFSQDALRHHVASSTGDVAAIPAFRLPPIASKVSTEQQQQYLRKGTKPSRLPLPNAHHRVYAASPASPVGGTYYTGPGPGHALGPALSEKKLPSIVNNSYTRLALFNNDLTASTPVSHDVPRHQHGKNGQCAIVGQGHSHLSGFGWPNNLPL